MYFNYDHLNFVYEPFPIGLAKPVMDEQVYSELTNAWPDTELFEFKPELGNKYALSQKFHSRQYHDFVSSTPVWKGFHRWIKSDDFVYGIIDVLKKHNIDLGYKRMSFPRRMQKRIKNVLHGNLFPRIPKLRARFEFQMMPANGGHILPHTDTPQKIITLVISMAQEGAWDPAFGGGTDMNRPKDIRQNFNYLNRQSRFEDMEVVNTFEYTPNQAVIFIKTFNSWHSVQPMQGTDSSAMRKTLIINIEKPKDVVI